VFEVVEGDGSVREEEVSGREARERGPAEVHDHLHERRELRVGLHPPPQLAREQLQQPPQLLLGPIRPRGALGPALRGAKGQRSTAAERDGASDDRARRDALGVGGAAAGGRESVGRVEGEAEAEVERRRRRHGGRSRSGARKGTSGGKELWVGTRLFRFAKSILALPSISSPSIC